MKHLGAGAGWESGSIFQPDDCDTGPARDILVAGCPLRLHVAFSSYVSSEIFSLFVV